MKKYLFNPPHGAPIKNWYDGSERWTLEVDEVKGFPLSVADKMKEIFGFLQEVSEEVLEAYLSKLQVSKVKVEGTEIVPKTEDEIAKEEAEVEVKKEEVKKIKAKVKKAKDAKPEEVNYETWSRGEVFAEVVKRKIEIKGLGKNRISKENLISMLKNDDASK